jgi:hypothetical protein
LQIMPSGRLRGKVVTQTLVVNEGAFYEGQLEMPTSENRVAGGTAPRQIPASGPSGAPVQIPTQQAQRSGAQAAEGQPGSKTFIRRFGGPETPWDNEGQERQAQGETPDEGEER